MERNEQVEQFRSRIDMTVPWPVRLVMALYFGRSLPDLLALCYSAGLTDGERRALARLREEGK